MWRINIESRSSINREAVPFAGAITQSEILSTHIEMINDRELKRLGNNNHHEPSKGKKQNTTKQRLKLWR